MKHKKQKKYYYTYKDANGWERINLWTKKQADDAVKNMKAFDLVKLG